MYNVPAPRSGSKNSVLRTTRTDALHAGFTLPDATPYRLWQVMSISNRMFPLQKIAVWIMGTTPMTVTLWRIDTPHWAFFLQILGLQHTRRPWPHNRWRRANSECSMALQSFFVPLLHGTGLLLCNRSGCGTPSLPPFRSIFEVVAPRDLRFNRLSAIAR